MFDDHEVECLYLGKPFEEKVLHGRDNRAEKHVLSLNEVERLLSTLPLLNELVHAVCAGVS